MSPEADKQGPTICWTTSKSAPATHPGADFRFLNELTSIDVPSDGPFPKNSGPLPGSGNLSPDPVKSAAILALPESLFEAL